MTIPSIGNWSSEHTGLYYSAFEDVTLSLAADGTGSVAFTRPGYSEFGPA